MTESPNLEMLLVSSSWGRFAILCSMGKVTSCSTSWPASEGQTVMICTWLLVISGTASMGNFDALQTPQMMSNNVTRPMTSLLLILNFIIWFSTNFLLNVDKWNRLQTTYSCMVWYHAAEQFVAALFSLYKSRFNETNFSNKLSRKFRRMPYIGYRFIG